MKVQRFISAFFIAMAAAAAAMADHVRFPTELHPTQQLRDVAQRASGEAVAPRPASNEFERALALAVRLPVLGFGIEEPAIPFGAPSVTRSEIPLHDAISNPGTPGSSTLILASAGGLLLVRGAGRAVRKLHAGSVSDWLHANAPQVGYVTPLIDDAGLALLDLNGLTPIDSPIVCRAVAVERLITPEGSFHSLPRTRGPPRA